VNLILIVRQLAGRLRCVAAITLAVVGIVAHVTGGEARPAGKADPATVAKHWAFQPWPAGHEDFNRFFSRRRLHEADSRSVTRRTGSHSSAASRSY